MSMQPGPAASPVAQSAAGWGFGALLMGIVLAALALPLVWLIGLSAMMIWPEGEPGRSVDNSGQQGVERRLHPATVPPEDQMHEARDKDAARGTNGLSGNAAGPAGRLDTADDTPRLPEEAGLGESNVPENSPAAPAGRD